MRLLYAVTLFTSAALLFWLQPLFSKTILPLFGGAPSVWNTCMMFYQSALLAGYAYSHYSTHWLGTKKQSLLHLCLLLLALVWLPLPMTSDFTFPPLDSPIVWLFMQLCFTIGMPLFVLSANAPLLQSWFSQTQDERSRDPYFLYAASNTGTCAVLMAYPFLIEPLCGISQQTALWGYVYTILIVLVAVCSFMLWRFQKEGADHSNSMRHHQDEDIPDVPDLLDCLEWVMWAFIPSVLLLGVTQYITTDVASVPFFWALPLAVYMATFAIVFSRNPLVPHHWIQLAQPFILIPPLATIVAGTGLFFWIDLTVHLAALFVHCMFCHGELARRRPHPAHLTVFYFCLATGGVLGSVFVTLTAPLLFATVMEYPLALLLMVYVCWKWNPAAETKNRTSLIALLLGLLALSLCLAAEIITFVSTPGVLALVWVSTLIGPAIMRNLQQSLAVRTAFLMVTAAGFYLTMPDKPVLYRSRDFFGSYKIIHNERWDQNELYVGTTIHGTQFNHPDLKTYPAGYFDPEGAVGEIFFHFNEAYPTANTAVCGLGVGTIAAYGRAGQSMTFYEINPKVYEIAAESGYFSYLHDSLADIHTVFGDARVAIQSAVDHSYDFIILDAFNSDSVPVHLLTLEAFEVYKSKLKPGGWLAVQISNRYLDLKPVIFGAVMRNGWTALLHDEEIDPGLPNNNRMESTWVVIFQNDDWVETFMAMGIWERLPLNRSFPAWTDNHASILPLLKTPEP